MNVFTKLPVNESLDGFKVLHEPNSGKQIFVSTRNIHMCYYYDTNEGVFPAAGLADKYCTFRSALRWIQSGKDAESAHCGSSEVCRDCNNFSNNAVYYLLVDLPEDYPVIDGCPCRKCVSSLQV